MQIIISIEVVVFDDNPLVIAGLACGDYEVAVKPDEFKRPHVMLRPSADFVMRITYSVKLYVCSKHTSSMPLFTEIQTRQPLLVF